MGGEGVLSAKVGECTVMHTTVLRDGMVVGDMTPYLGAAAHLFVVSADLKLSQHTHGMIMDESMTTTACSDSHAAHPAPPPAFNSSVRPRVGLLNFRK